MKRLFLIVSLLGLYVFADAINYYVSDISGNNSKSGLSTEKAFKTIQRAADLTLPGDTVFVMNGKYTNAFADGNVVTITRSGTQDAWIVYMNYPHQRPVIQFTGWQGFQLTDGASYIEINGFVISGNSEKIALDSALIQPGSCKNPGGTINPRYNGTGIQMFGLINASKRHPHHVRIVNNTIYNCCGAGISGIQSDYMTIENNTIYNNGWYTIFGSSGIVLYQNWNFNNDTIHYRMIIRNNRVFGNMNFIPWPGAPCAITDGNGIIIDDGKNTQNESPYGPYHGRTYIANNLVYGNGGAGIHVFLSEHVSILNNTAFSNQQTPVIFNGEIDASFSDDIIIRNNILYAKTNKPVNTNLKNHHIVYDCNLYYGGNGYFVHDASSIVADPQFINPSLSITADFRVKEGSPSIDKGSALLAPDIDIDGAKRPSGESYDIGAYESNK